MYKCLFKDSEMVKYIPFIFTSDMVHEDMHLMFDDCPQFKHLRECGHVISLRSAGNYDPVYCTTSGRSETLNLSAFDIDGNIILTYEYGNGFGVDDEFT